MGIAVLAALVCARAAAADAPDFSNLAWSVGNTNVVVHYSTMANDPDAITPDQARLILDTIEPLWAQETSWGFVAPTDAALVGEDARLDVFVKNAPDHRSFAAGGFALDGTPWAYIDLDPQNLFGAGGSKLFRGTIAHELFHTIQLHYALEAPFLAEATAEWAAVHASPKEYLAVRPLFVDVPEASLDCPGDVCGDPAGIGAGYGQWPFFEYLSQRWGKHVIRDIWRAAKQLQAPDLAASPDTLPPSHALEAIDEALQWHKSSLSKAYAGYVKANLMPRWYQNRLLRTIVDLRPPRRLDVVSAQPHVLKTQTISVDHLASTSVTLATPDCVVARKTKKSVLHVSVDLPFGIESQTWFRFTNGGRRPTVKAPKLLAGEPRLVVGRRAVRGARLRYGAVVTESPGVAGARGARPASARGGAVSSAQTWRARMRS
jgi:hypothetical protein